MIPNSYNEVRSRGRFDFPIEFYHVDKVHPRFYMPYHWHMDYEIIHILNGTLNITLNETALTAQPGDTIFIRDGIVHGGSPASSDCIYECLVFNLEALLRNNVNYNDDLQKILNHDLRINKYFPAQLNEIHFVIDKLFSSMHLQKDGYELLVRGLLYSLLGIIVQEKYYHAADLQNLDNDRKHIQQIKQAFRLINTCYDSALTLEQMAEAAQLSPSYFCKVFMKMTQKRPIEYLNYYRTEVACNLLSTTALSVIDISYRCGFNNLSYFTKLFKKYHHITPTGYRKLAAK